ncbi:ABC transporter ATP-binding protein [Rhodococcus sovatensis]|uniref:ABC transporter ATP-binding protein n=1 Tax=Rhodococcus sovatensis TaxID=1805840 RepID=A0ABZ2PQY2_9NOCA
MSTMTEGSTAPLLRAENVTVRLRGGPPIVKGVDLELARGEILGIVGESGSGKTTLARSLLGHCATGLDISDGSLLIDGTARPMDESLRFLRGRTISYVPQDPGRALNPALTIQESIQDVIKAHTGAAASDGDMAEHFDRVGLPSTEQFRRRLPHQLSGGQQQRVCIAIALACKPPVVVLDEPTTGLDVVTQARILAELGRLRMELGVSMIYVTHDLAVVAQIADRVAVMYDGRVVEQGPVHEVLTRPRHPYTLGLLASTPDHLLPRTLQSMPGIAPGVEADSDGCSFVSRCPVSTGECSEHRPPMVETGSAHSTRCFEWKRTDTAEFVPFVPPPARAATVPVLTVSDLSITYGSGARAVTVATNIEFTLNHGSCVALVGESGSGKTSIARAVSGLIAPTSGSVSLGEETLPPLARARTTEQRRKVQLVFQNPADALNPRRTVFDQIGRPARLLRRVSRSGIDNEVERLLDSVRLPRRVKNRYPAELSGGERQRVAIARALAAGPEVLVCDEITSALDVSVQAAVLDLMSELRSTGTSLLFITHDLGVVSTIADQVLVLDKGIVCEHGPVSTVLSNPQSPYTKTLLGSAPSVSQQLPTGSGAFKSAPLAL